MISNKDNIIIDGMREESFDFRWDLEKFEHYLVNCQFIDGQMPEHERVISAIKQFRERLSKLESLTMDLMDE